MSECRICRGPATWELIAPVRPGDWRPVPEPARRGRCGEIRFSCGRHLSRLVRELSCQVEAGWPMPLASVAVTSIDKAKRQP